MLASPFEEGSCELLDSVGRVCLGATRPVVLPASGPPCGGAEGRRAKLKILAFEGYHEDFEPAVPSQDRNAPKLALSDERIHEETGRQGCPGSVQRIPPVLRKPLGDALAAGAVAASKG